MGKIYITGLEVDTLIGVYDWERVRTTQLLLDVTLDVDLSAAMQSDDVVDTVDHATVVECIVAVWGARKRPLGLKYNKDGRDYLLRVLIQMTKQRRT